ncbi:hypothetical protein KI387_013538 [Taxus chinensis]|uniref:Uncharacterized protein n=1 Tax=Taxus chinensis TaxID=29808 RepID=A0AA38CK48_TAXCH|nr:hypothetical protein KI387_013538 [Taxus chinensis]
MITTNTIVDNIKLTIVQMMIYFIAGIGQKSQNTELDYSVILVYSNMQLLIETGILQVHDKKDGSSSIYASAVTKPKMSN